MCCSLAVAGEFLQTLARDKGPDIFDEIMGKLWTYHAEGRLTFSGIDPHASEAHATARELQRKDPQLSSADAFILASFLTDAQATTFYTTDAELIGSRVVKEMCQARGKRIRDIAAG